MSKLTFLKQYNNYFNRIVKNNKSELLLGYTKQDFNNINFNPNDGLTTEQIVNWPNSWTPDYMMVNLTELGNGSYWTDYMTGFYFAQREGRYDIEYTGTNAEVKANLHHIPYWDEDYERYEYIDSLSPDERAMDMTMIYNKFRGEINWNWYQFGYDFGGNGLPVTALNMLFDEVAAERNPGNYDYYYIDIFFNAPVGGYVRIPSVDFLNRECRITYNTLKEYLPTLPSTATIYNIEINPNNQDDYTDSQFGPWGISAHEGSSGNELESSWFVTEWQRTRNGQYKATLKRDIVADNYNNVLKAPAIINRAKITNPENALLYNPEGFSFNQIKKNEYLLQDSSKTPWYVLYFKKGLAKVTGGFTPTSMAQYDVEINTTIANSIYSSGDKYYTTNVKPGVRYRVSATDWAWAYGTNQYIMWLKENSNPSYEYESYSMLTDVMWFANMQDTCSSQLNRAFQGQYNTLKNKLIADTGYSSSISTSDYNTLKSIPKTGIIVKDVDNKLWEVKCKMVTNTKSGNLSGGTYKDAVKNLIDSTSLDQADHFGSRTCTYKMDIVSIVMDVHEYTNQALNWEIDFANKTNTVDSDFDIIAVPYYSIENTSSTFTIPSDISEMLVHSIAQASGVGDNLVDIQLIPYCPVQRGLAGPYINFSVLQSSEYYTNGSGTGLMILYLSSSNFSFNISQPFEASEDALERKVANETKLYKLVSPNYNGSFEFSPAKNGGISLFNVDITLIPYNPYIHINPNFSGLYGQDFNDSRGLICGGDFSLPRYTDKFAEYELQNKNYQQIFDRQLRNLDVNESLAMKQQEITAGIGIVKGGVTGAAAGGMVGGGWGALAGGVTGTVTSMAGGAADTLIMSEQLAEQRSFAIDNYNFQLGNIKALPDTINKCTPLTYNHKLWPFVEEYSASDEEIRAFKEYLEYNSMRIEAVGKIEDYKQYERTFISADIIRLDDIAESSNEAFEIYKIIKQGVYM